MDAGSNRARAWLCSHRLDFEPTPLVVKRLRARRQAAVAEIVTVLAGTVAVVAYAGAFDLGIEVFQIGMMTALVVGAIVGMGWQRWLERPLLAGRTTRTAHPAAPSVVRIVGRGPLAEAGAVFGGGLLLGAALTALSPPGTERLLALTFVVGVALLGGLAALGLAAVVRRPALAEDHETLLFDDALRAEDARRVLLPYPLLLAFQFAVIAADGWTVIVLLAYTVAGGVGWYLGERSVRCAAVRKPVTL